MVRKHAEAGVVCTLRFSDILECSERYETQTLSEMSNIVRIEQIV